MKRHLKKQYTRILKLALFAAIIVLLIIIFGFAKDFIQDLMDKLDYLVKYTEAQSTHIQGLEQELHNLETANASLKSVVLEQHQQIQELTVNGNTMTFRPREMTMDDLHNEIAPQLHTETTMTDIIGSPQTVAITVMTFLSVVKSTLGSLVLP